MCGLNGLPVVGTVSGSDQVHVFSASIGFDARSPLSSILAYFQTAFASPTMATQFAVPGDGFSIAVSQGGSNTWVLLQPVAPLASGTVTLPLNASAPDGQEVTITATQLISALSIGLNGASALFGAPASLSASTPFRLRFYRATNSWYRVG